MRVTVRGFVEALRVPLCMSGVRHALQLAGRTVFTIFYYFAYDFETGTAITSVAAPISNSRHRSLFACVWTGNLLAQPRLIPQGIEFT